MRLFAVSLLAASAAHAQQGLTEAEREDFAVQVARCWNVDDLAPSQPVVTVTFSLSPEGVPAPNSLALIGAGKDTSEAVKAAYGAARRAILRCGAKGYKLPVEKYETWRKTELTFNPERMSLR